jgi:nicotinate-nucleotide adenylyltransferase
MYHILKRREHSLTQEHSSFTPSVYTRRMGILGGTFDPVHYGHLVIAEEVRVALDLTEVIFIPAGHPPHKLSRAITPASHRVTMLELALASNPYFSCSRIEVERDGPSYTVDTLRTLRQQEGAGTALFFIIGWDSLTELHTWHEAPALLTTLTHLVAVQRPGYEDDEQNEAQNDYMKQLEVQLPGLLQRLVIVPAPQLDISATGLRARVLHGKPILYQTPEPVEAYIKKYKLYR